MPSKKESTRSKARSKSETIYDVLKNDHREVQAMVDEICEMEEKSERKLSIFEDMKSALLAHAHAEDMVFYDRLRSELKEPSLILEAKEEHKLVEALLYELSDTSLPDDIWQAKFSVFKENLEHHIEEEEEEVFKKAKKVIDKEEAREIGEQMKEEKKNFQENYDPESEPKLDESLISHKEAS